MSTTGKEEVSGRSVRASVRVLHVQEEVESPDVHFEPVVKLPPVQVKTHEEEEQEIFKM